MCEEIWKLINGTSYYEVSNLGRVRRIDHYRTHIRDGKTYKRHYDEYIMKLAETWDGYLSTSITFDDARGCKDRFVHRLVAEAFLIDWNPELQVNHINGIKTDNCVDNLEMVTCQENIDHFWNHPAMKEARKLKHIRTSRSSKEVMSRPDVKIRESEKQGTHVKCIEDNLVFSSRTVCAKYYKVGYDLIEQRCKYGQPKYYIKLPNKNFKYVPEEEYQSFKKENPERVIIYV